MRKEFAKSLAPWLGKTMKMVDNRIDEVFEINSIELTKMQFVLLKIVDSNEGINQNELAIFANRDKSSLTRLINTLEKKGFLARIPSKKDKRVNSLVITRKGKSILQKAIPVLLETITIFEKGLTKEEIETTIKTLQKIQENIGANEASICIDNDFKKTKK